MLVRKILVLTLLSLLLSLLLIGPAAAVEIDKEDGPVARIGQMMLALPDLGPVAPRQATLATDLVELGPAIKIKPGVLVQLEGQTIFDRGPTDGLEVLLCLQGGKNHEALAWLPTANAELIKGAMIIALDVHDGVPSEEESGLPARGTPLRVRLRWQPDVFLEPDRWVEVDASQMVRDRLTQRPYPALPYVYTGSRMLTVNDTGPDGAMIRRQRFALDITKSVIVNFDEADALLASPFPLAMRDLVFEVNSAIAPPPRTPVQVIIEPATLALTLTMASDGSLRRGDDVSQTALDDMALGALLKEHYGPEATPELRALDVRVDPTAERARDQEVRERILVTAAANQAWVVPIFTVPQVMVKP